jgi:hypothetical protein
LVEGKKLPSIKEAEKIFSESLSASCKPGLDETEALWLQVVADLAQVYKAVAIGYVDVILLDKSLEVGFYEG